jgi:hypothetical protein
VTYLRQRYIMDVGTLTQTLDIPQRWYQYIIWQLAFYMFAESPDSDPAALPTIQAGIALSQPVTKAERDASPLMISANIRPYTK